jgi:hypothetical protein
VLKINLLDLKMDDDDEFSQEQSVVSVSAEKYIPEPNIFLSMAMEDAPVYGK